MAENEETEVEETEVVETEETDDEDGWARMEEIVSKAVEEKLSSWSGPQEKKTKTSSRSPRKAALPQRKKGFLSSQFFSGLDPKE